MSPAILQTIAEEALSLAGPSILRSISFLHETESRIAAHAVILDPTVRFAEGRSLPILASRTFGERDSRLWKSDYRVFAQSKANICWRTGMSSRYVGENASWLYLPNDTKYPGGIIRDGLIFAVSGLNWRMDEPCAEVIASFFWGRARMIRDEIMADKTADFF